MGKADGNEQPATQAAGHRSRLRERFRRARLVGFHDYEVLELLLTFAIPRRDVKPYARALLKRFGSLRGVFDAGPEDLQSVENIGPSAATLICLLKEAANLYLKLQVQGRPILSSTQAVLDYCRHSLSGEREEKFLGIFLTAQNEILAIEILAEGTVDRAAVHPRRVLELALKHNAVGVVFVHNHPDGPPSPSPQDRRLTDILTRAARAADITVHDHLIVGRDGHFSFRDAGILPGEIQ
jgi:DNA repair protein RadC